MRRLPFSSCHQVATHRIRALHIILRWDVPATLSQYPPQPSADQAQHWTPVSALTQPAGRCRSPLAPWDTVPGSDPLNFSNARLARSAQAASGSSAARGSSQPADAASSPADPAAPHPGPQAGDLADGFASISLDDEPAAAPGEGAVGESARSPWQESQPADGAATSNGDPPSPDTAASAAADQARDPASGGSSAGSPGSHADGQSAGQPAGVSASPPTHHMATASCSNGDPMELSNVARLLEVQGPADRLADAFTSLVSYLLHGIHGSVHQTAATAHPEADIRRNMSCRAMARMACRHPPRLRSGGALQADEAWQDFTAADGTLDSLLSEQEGELCGPRPRAPGQVSMHALSAAPVAGCARHSWSILGCFAGESTTGYGSLHTGRPHAERVQITPCVSHSVTGSHWQFRCKGMLVLAWADPPGSSHSCYVAAAESLRWPALHQDCLCLLVSNAWLIQAVLPAVCLASLHVTMCLAWRLVCMHQRSGPAGKHGEPRLWRGRRGWQPGDSLPARRGRQP